MNRFLRKVLPSVCLLCAFSLAGCGEKGDAVRSEDASEPSPRVVAPMSPASVAADIPRNVDLVNIVVAIVGCSDRTRVLRAIAENANVKRTSKDDVLSATVVSGNESIQFKTATTRSAIEHAKLLAEADIALFVVDMTEGPIPMHREHALLLRQTGVPHVRIVFLNCTWVTDEELADLVERETREVLRQYEAPSENYPAIYELTPPTKPSTPIPTLAQQIVARVAVIARLRAAAHKATESTKSTASKATIYVLSLQEQFRDKPLSVLATDNYEAFVGTKVVTMHVEGQIDAGSNGSAKLTFAEPVAFGAGERIVLFSDDRVVAIGFITD